MGASTFSEEGGQKRKRRGSNKMFFTLPTLLSSLPTLDVVFWVGKNALLPTHITIM